MIVAQIIWGTCFFGIIFWFAATYQAKNPWTFHILAVLGGLLATAVIADVMGVTMPWNTLENIFTKNSPEIQGTEAASKSNLGD
jgi:hypothetical protein